MVEDRRSFFGKALAVGASAVALGKSVKSWAKGLPSDPGQPESTSANPGDIVLPGFEKNSPYSLDQALLSRRTDRSYDKNGTLSEEELSRLMWAACSREDMSRILWAANGVNRANGHRTTPSAVAAYPVDIYVALKDGVFFYNEKKHILEKKSSEDILNLIPIQPGLSKACMKLLYVINKKDIPGGEDSIAWADMEIGFMVQNVYLEAAQLGLGCCVFAIVRYDKVSAVLGLTDKQTLRIAQAVGPLR